MHVFASGRTWRVALFTLLGLTVLLVGCKLPNIAPIANAGHNISAPIGEVVSLDGTESFDFNDDPLNYTWTLVTRPTFSRAELAFTETQGRMDLLPDRVGVYTAELVVSDGVYQSTPDRVVITITDSASDGIVPVPLPPYPGLPIDHANFTSSCAGCHGKTAGGKSVKHVRSSDKCEICHIPTTWFALRDSRPLQTSDRVLVDRPMDSSMSWLKTGADVAQSGQQLLGLTLARNTSGRVVSQIPVESFQLKPGGATAWQTFARSAEQTASDRTSEIVQTESGEVFAVWSTAGSVYIQQYVAGKGWAKATPLATNTLGPIVDVSLRRDNLGTLIVTWVRDLRRMRQLGVATLDTNGVWQSLPALNLAVQTDITSLAITSLVDGSVAAVWNQWNRRVTGDLSADGLWGSVYVANSGWAMPAKREGAHKGSVPIVKQAYMFATEMGAKVIFVSMPEVSVASWPQYWQVQELNLFGTHWQKPTDIATRFGAALTIGDVRASANAKGQLALSWPSYDAKTSEYVVSVAAELGTGGWQSADPISFDIGQSDGLPHLDVNVGATGDVLAVWSQISPLPTWVADPFTYQAKVYSRRYFAAIGAWGAAIPVFVGDSVLPKSVMIVDVKAELDAKNQSYVYWTALTGAAFQSSERVVVMAQAPDIGAVKLVLQ